MNIFACCPHCFFRSLPTLVSGPACRAGAGGARAPKPSPSAISPSSTRGWSASAACRPICATSSAKPSAPAPAWRSIRNRGCETADGYQGTFYMLPDRGYNVAGTTDYRARLNKLSVTFKPLDDPAACRWRSAKSSVVATLTDTILLTDAAGQSLTGLDPGPHPRRGERVPGSAAGLERPRQHRYRIPGAVAGRRLFHRRRIRSLYLSLLADRPHARGDQAAGSFHSQTQGQGQFSSNNPGPGAQAPEPRNPETGRQNNQGFEGLTLTPGGRFLVVGLQSATRQDGGNFAGNAAVHPDALLRYRRSRSAEARARARHSAAGVRKCRRQAAGRRPERAARARRDAFPPALPRWQQRLRHRRHDLALSQHRARRHVAVRPTSPARPTTARCRSPPTASLPTASCPQR